ncbi:GIY-YIG nuclease family protein [Clostridium botulinum]|uniref:GIY-YIG nuclease family protein n=1 Tax=Clostridium botulinum TaxID=1491 RepID=UPI003DA224BB
MNNNKSLKWLKEQNNIIIDDKDKEKILDISNPVRGIYGIFIAENGEEKCVYVGRSNSIYDRLICGHVTNLMKKKHTNQQLQNAMDNGKNIKIKILIEVPYKFDNYYKDMQRLASEENKCIDKYQEMDQCLEQVPEGTGLKKEKWEEIKKNK